ncbi:MAG: FAD-binding protein [Clostridiales bacterium]|nr:FAD-binding protein [Clostridiales bacterium]
MRILSCNTAVVGAGAAGLNAADELKRRGVDVLLLADSPDGGASLNAGSDKQTYYKLSLAGGAPDSPAALARAFFDGGGAHGDLAHAMAASSARAFLKLALLGVPFPHNEWGEYVGYRTDHDAGGRATSAGPLTSRMMVEALARSTRERGVRRVDGLHLASILIGPHDQCQGLLMLDPARPDDRWVLVNALFTVLCTGGPALVYRDTVYPAGQAGSTGAALRAGAEGSNLCYWQYGLASIGVRWNVSGSYQQALPAYTDGSGEFLLPRFASPGDMLDSVFLKGYQWPFDSRRLSGSSRVDAAVLALTAAGGAAHLDFSREPLGGALRFAGPEARDYLAKCGATGDTPIDRLQAMNPAAVRFYASHGVDLRSQPLPVAVCAQHANGGLKIDRWWRTTVDCLYAAGECAGAFGVYRPGGSALNETQVGSLRAAQHIASHGGDRPPLPEPAFLRAVEGSLNAELRLHGRPAGDGAAELLADLRADMSACAGAMRSVRGMAALLARVERAIQSPPPAASALWAIRLADVLAVQRDALAAMLLQAQYAGDAGHSFLDRPPISGAPDGRGLVFETRQGRARATPVRPLPEGGGWFEEVWRRYESGAVFDDPPEGGASR